MAGQVAIINSGLLMIGETGITNIDDQTKAAIAAKILWPLLRDQVIADHPWNCAVKRANLAADTTAPAWGYTYRYRLPADCLRVLSLQGLDQEGDWKREGPYILTNQSGPIYVLYIAQITEPELYDPILADALSCKIAARLVMYLQQNATAMQAMEERYQLVLAQARGVDAQEGMPDAINDDVFLRARQ